MRVLVTGATGCLGSHLLKQLIESSDQVRGLVRSVHAVDKLQSQGVEVYVGDLTDPESLEKAVSGVNVVYHTAAKVSSASATGFLAVNVQGTSNLLEASLQTGVERFIYVSSAAIYQSGDVRPLKEDGPQRHPGDSYIGSKVQVEQIVWRYYRDYGLPVSIIRPCTIYGERDRHFIPWIMRMLKAPIWLLPNRGDNRVEMVYVEDVVRALLSVVTRPSAIGQAYNITDGQETTLRDIAEACRMANGGRPLLIGLPTILSRPLLWSVDLIRGPDRLLPLLQNVAYDITKAQKELGYVPRVDVREGIRRCISWWRSERVDDLDVRVGGRRSR